MFIKKKNTNNINFIRNLNTSLILNKDVNVTKTEKEKISYKYKENCVCVYVSIGQKKNSVVRMYEELEKFNSMWNTILIISNANESAPLQFLAPYTGCTLGEYFRDNGFDAVVFYDDLTKHSYSYRQMLLLLERTVGREAYPADIFYIHSRLLERAAQLSENLGFGSLTAFPVVETQFSDISAYIPTNIISITDGQIFLDTDIFYKGIRPAIHTGLSVSRVGSSAQNFAMKSISYLWREALAIYREMEAFSLFGSSEGDLTGFLLARGMRLNALLHQEENHVYTVEEQIIVIYAGVFGYMDHVNPKDISLYEKVILYFFKKVESKLYLFNLFQELELHSLNKRVEKRLIKGLLFLNNYYSKNLLN